MTYSTLMVHLDLYQSNDAVLGIAGTLAERFNAAVIGIAAWQPLQVLYSDGYVDGEIYEQDRTYIDQGIKDAEKQFLAGLRPKARELEWRSALPTFASDYVAHQARCADLVIVGAAPKDPSEGSSRRLDIGEFVMRVGRPVLVAPPSVSAMQAENVLVAWKDTREARRAALDAVPLLKKAKRVVVAEIAEEQALQDARHRVKDVANWLRRHEIAAESVAVQASGGDTEQIASIAQRHEADLIVAGAYGHSRLREWAFGGVTRDLLKRAELCSLVSH